MDNYNDIILQMPLNKKFVKQIPLVQTCMELNKQAILNELNEFKLKNPDLNFIVIGSAAITLQDNSYVPIKDIDIVIFDDNNVNRPDRFDILNWKTFEPTNNDWRQRLININGFNVLNVRDILVTMICNCDQFLKIRKFFSIIDTDEIIKNQFLDDMEKFKINVENSTEEQLPLTKKQRFLKNIFIMKDIFEYKMYSAVSDEYIDSIINKITDEIPEFYIKKLSFK